MAKKATAKAKAKRKFIQLSEGELNYAMSRAVVQGDCALSLAQWVMIIASRSFPKARRSKP